MRCPRRRRPCRRPSCRHCTARRWPAPWVACCWAKRELLLWFWLWPELRAHWRAEAWSGQMVLGAPFGDLVWAVLFGAAHPSVLLLAMRLGR